MDPKGEFLNTSVTVAAEVITANSQYVRRFADIIRSTIGGNSRRLGDYILVYSLAIRVKVTPAPNVYIDPNWESGGFRFDLLRDTQATNTAPTFGQVYGGPSASLILADYATTSTSRFKILSSATSTHRFVQNFVTSGGGATRFVKNPIYQEYLFDFPRGLLIGYDGEFAHEFFKDSLHYVFFADAVDCTLDMNVFCQYKNLAY